MQHQKLLSTFAFYLCNQTKTNTVNRYLWPYLKVHTKKPMFTVTTSLYSNNITIQLLEIMGIRRLWSFPKTKKIEIIKSAHKWKQNDFIQFWVPERVYVLIFCERNIKSKSNTHNIWVEICARFPFSVEYRRVWPIVKPSQSAWTQ